MNHMINIKLFYVLFGWNRYIYVRSCDIQAHLGLGLQPDNVAHTVPKPRPQVALKPIEQKIFISSYHPRLLGHTR